MSYISMLRSSSMGTGHIAVFSSGKNTSRTSILNCYSSIAARGSYSNPSNIGGETAGSVACSSCGGFSGGGSSGGFSAIT